MESKSHWEKVYREKEPDGVSWYQEHAERSLALIDKYRPQTDAQLIDVGAGASTLIDDLLRMGYQNLTVLDISAAGLNVARERLGAEAERVSWIEADITSASLPRHRYDLWHDRAVFHFLTEPEDRAKYIQVMSASLKPDGIAIIGTFAEEGPSQCSGLPTERYSAASLATVLGDQFEALESAYEVHLTPNGRTQQFLYGCFGMRSNVVPTR
ncbi:class I SAM-dependent methyltransferase [Pseudomonas moraviensis subsp. stanleyae]|uniref:class I SAM-dependent methyltransferase n=1 Tax=Pseudomonas moraviensis TaxID=321662 RepID=UPI002E363FEF|nr:class I SAM-dependent methyltransferase [Pseudomonas moraviensis]MED7666739.1 class I SAM-dependent methyltransferase [Pseudomonas moraviensis subsp. stanleyae]